MFRHHRHQPWKIPFFLRRADAVWQVGWKGLGRDCCNCSSSVWGQHWWQCWRYSWVTSPETRHQHLAHKEDSNFLFAWRNPVQRIKEQEMSLQKWPSRHILSGAVLLLAQSLVLLGIFPWGTVTHNRDIQDGLSSFRYCGINGYFGVVLPVAAPSSQLHPNESFNWTTKPNKLLKSQ